jgi:mono/diheme cytochrome c family protein
MPPFGWRYGDADIAKLATFVRANWGNSAPPVTAAQVANVRKQRSD